MKYFILNFDSTHHALKSEKLLNNIGIKFDIIPTPKEISSDCGIAIRIKPQLYDERNISSLFEKNNITFYLHEKDYQ